MHLKYLYIFIKNISNISNIVHTIREVLIIHPISGGTTNAWGAREAWMSEKQAPEWGLRQYREPIWEVLNALSLSLIDLDLAMMFPLRAKHVKEIASQFFAEISKLIEDRGYHDWVSTNLKR